MGITSNCFKQHLAIFIGGVLTHWTSAQLIAVAQQVGWGVVLFIYLLSLLSLQLVQRSKITDKNQLFSKSKTRVSR